MPSFTSLALLFPDCKNVTYVKQQNIALPLACVICLKLSMSAAGSYNLYPPMLIGFRVTLQGKLTKTFFYHCMAFKFLNLPKATCESWEAMTAASQRLVVIRNTRRMLGLLLQDRLGRQLNWCQLSRAVYIVNILVKLSAYWAPAELTNLM